MTREIDAEQLHTVARDRFGYAGFLPGRLDAMLAVARGRDTLVVMPTGAGRSAIYLLREDA